jgi:hypothetical protein
MQGGGGGMQGGGIQSGGIRGGRAGCKVGGARWQVLDACKAVQWGRDAKWQVWMQGGTFGCKMAGAECKVAEQDAGWRGWDGRWQALEARRGADRKSRGNWPAVLPCITLATYWTENQWQYHGQGIAVQCSAVQCSAVQCSAVQCSAVQCSAVQRISCSPV